MATPSSPPRRQALASSAAWGLGGALGWSGSSVLQPAAAQTAQTPGAAIGDLVRRPTVQLLDQRAWGAAQAAGQVVVAVFFSTTCPYCLRHNQRITRMADSAGPRGLQVLGVAHETDRGRVLRHMRDQGHRFDVTLDEQPMHQALSARRSVPLTCVVDRAGRLREVIPGEMAEDDVLGLARWLNR